MQLNTLDAHAEPFIKPEFFTRTEAYARCPELAGAVDYLQTKYHHNKPASNEAAAGLIVNSTQLLGLKLEELRGTALVLLLPTLFEPYLLDAVSREPMCMNTPSLDLMHNISIASWPAGEYCITVLADALYDVAIADANHDDIADGFYVDDATPIPVVMIAGNSVAVGGFYVDDDWMGGLQAQGAGSGSNWRPFLVYDHIDIAEASVEAKKHGLIPWAGKLWRGRIGLSVFDWRPKVQ